MTIPRIGLTPRAALHSEVLQLWAELEGRSVADVCLTLIENGLRDAARQGDMPQPCIDLMRCDQKGVFKIKRSKPED